MRIQHNIMAMNAYRNYTNNTSALAKNLEKLSSGYRINRAGDDAAGLAISEKMRAQITALGTAQKNVKDGISLVKTAEGATQEIHDMLNRMVSLAEQSANGTYQNEVDREAITNEFNQLKEEINRITKSSNFNGIKLLDGSLADEQVATKIEISGSMRAYKSVGSKASYATTEVLTGYGTKGDTAGKQAEDGDTLTFNIGFTDGTSTSVTMKFDYDKKALTSVDGKTTYGTLADKDAATQAELQEALKKALESTDIANEFDISYNANKLTLTSQKVGSGGREVGSFDMIAKDAAGNQKAYAVDATAANAADKTKAGILGVTAKAGLDEGIEIKADELVEYNGTNYDDAVFTINGKKFVVLANDQDPNATADPAVANQDHLRAVTGLGSDVTILVGGIGGLMGGADATAPAVGGAADAANSNFKQNIKAIADATGLKVTAGIDESANNPAGTDGGASPTTGIRLSLGGQGTKGGGLTLQIGDTSDDFNQMRVSIKAMDTKALGIDNLDLGTQKGAQAAMGAIKDAINYVSDVRGTLGATQNRLEHTANNLSTMKENIQDAESTIRDTDIAEEMMAYTKNNILVQSAQAMLAQANQIPQGVLQLLG